VHRGESAQLGHADLKIAEHLQQKGLKLGIGAVDFIDQQNGRLFAEDGFQQWTLKEEAHGEKDVFLVSQAIGGFGQADGASQCLLELVSQQLCIQQLFRVFPFV